jgi:hypothetical protein
LTSSEFSNGYFLITGRNYWESGNWGAILGAGIEVGALGFGILVLSRVISSYMTPPPPIGPPCALPVGEGP